MPLPDLLQWLGGAGRTGTLEIERNKVVKRILFRAGRVIACSSNDPSDLLGHWLVSRGKISEETLRAALTLQGDAPRHLGELLVGMGAISREEIDRDLTTKAEESIFSLFEWPDGTFRYTDDKHDDADLYPIDLRVEDVLLRGAQRYDEIQRIRAVFNDAGIVLAKTARTPPGEALRNRMARTIYDLVNGERTVAEILLHAHGSEFAVTRFLFELHRVGLVEITATRPIAPETVPEIPWLRPEDARALEAPTTPGAIAPEEATAAPTATDLEVARNLLNRGDLEAALDILDAAYHGQGGDDALRRLLNEAEATFIDKAYRHYLPAAKIVALRRPLTALTGEPLSPAEFFLISRVDGTWDVRSIIQITPLREVEALRTLKRLRERGFIELHDPA